MKQFRKRNAILSFLRASRQHPSAEAVLTGLKSDFPDLSLGTVYRNLSLFKQRGLITSLGAVNGVERFDGNLTPHSHFVCSACGKVTDLPLPELPEPLCSTAAQLSGGRIDGCQVTFTGLCSSCLAAQKESEDIS